LVELCDDLRHFVRDDVVSLPTVTVPRAILKEEETIGVARKQIARREPRVQGSKGAAVDAAGTGGRIGVVAVREVERVAQWIRQCRRVRRIDCAAFRVWIVRLTGTGDHARKSLLSLRTRTMLHQC
jgi:hypothetical protein